jgi:hypothetical protein
MKTKLERPPQLEEGTYWIGRFEVKVCKDNLCVFSRQSFYHKHERIDDLFLTHFSSNYGSIGIKRHEDSPKAEERIRKILADREWKPRKIKVK